MIGILETEGVGVCACVSHDVYRQKQDKPTYREIVLVVPFQ